MKGFIFLVKSGQEVGEEEEAGTPKLLPAWSVTWNLSYKPFGVVLRNGTIEIGTAPAKSGRSPSKFAPLLILKSPTGAFGARHDDIPCLLVQMLQLHNLRLSQDILA